MKQLTLKKEAHLSGIGLHTGGVVKIVFKPAGPGTGIVFINKGEKYRLEPGIVAVTKLGTVLKKGRSVISTVEHMLAAIKAFGVDNLEIYVDGGEAPLLDGSAAGFAAAIKKVGVVKQKNEKKVFTLESPLLLKDGDKYMAALPGKGFVIRYFSDFSGRGIAPEEAGVRVTPENFMKEISGARTFGFKEDAEIMKKAGLIKGVNLNNAIVIEKGRPINGKLRFKNELARHKVLDIIGDFSFIEGEVNMTIIAYKTGHTENIKMVRMILNSISY